MTDLITALGIAIPTLFLLGMVFLQHRKIITQEITITGLEGRCKQHLVEKRIAEDLATSAQCKAKTALAELSDFGRLLDQACQADPELTCKLGESIGRRMLKAASASMSLMRVDRYADAHLQQHVMDFVIPTLHYRAAAPFHEVVSERNIWPEVVIAHARHYLVRALTDEMIEKLFKKGY